MSKTTIKSLAAYVDKATDLAEAVRNAVQHNSGVIDNKTVLALNDFIIAANNIKDLTDTLENDSIKLN